MAILSWFSNRNTALAAFTFSLIALMFVSSSRGVWAKSSSDFPLARFKEISHKRISEIGTISALLQDKYGFVWLGGQSGLARFDGYDFVIYEADPDNPQSISSNLIWDIFEDSRGQLWVATAWGLNRFDHKTQTFKTYFNAPSDQTTISHNIVKKIIEDKEGYLWLATEGGGINRFDWRTEKFTRYTSKQGPGALLDDFTLSLFADKHGNIWVGSTQGLSRFDSATGEFEHYFADEKINAEQRFNIVLSIIEDRHGKIWVGTLGGLCVLSESENAYSLFEIPERHLSLLGRHGVWALLEDEEGLLWVATDREGVAAINPARDGYQTYQYEAYIPGSMKANIVRAIMQDSSGDLWFGSFPSGIDYLNRAIIGARVLQHRPSHDNSLSHQSVMSIKEDKNGNLWLGTENGLNFYDREKDQFKYYKFEPGNENSLRAGWVMSIDIDHDDQLWLATWGGGLSRFDPVTETFEHFVPEESNERSISSKYIGQVFVDSQNKVWAATFAGGLNRFDRQENLFTRYMHDDEDKHSIAHDIVRTVYEDSAGKLWVGTRGGLDLFDPIAGDFNHFRYKPGDLESSSTDPILSIMEDKNKQLWVGTRSGLNILDKNRNVIKRIRKKDGLPNEVIRSIVEDEFGMIWLGTDAMLLRVDPLSFEIERFDNSGWLQGRYNIGAAIRAENSDLIFGNMDGLMLFNPKDLNPNRHEPSVLLTGFEIFNKPVSVRDQDSILDKAIYLTDTITLSHQQSVFSISYAALNFRNTSKNQYRYKLEGFDRDWIYAGERRRATYTNLDPGLYTFKVMGSNDEGRWNPVSTKIDIRVLPPVWATTQAYLIYLTIILICCAFIIRSHRHKVRVRKEAEIRSWNQANFDFLTGLPNRLMFHNRLEQEIRQSKRTNNRIALLSLDLDRFKEVNDTLGHDYGDILLKQVAGRLKECVRDVDTIARLGGDEFIIIISQLKSMGSVERIAQTILEVLAEPFQLELETAYLSTSIGITFYPEDADDVATLLKNVDQAMYAAKENGRDCFQYFTPSMQREALARMALINDLRVALPNEQFELVYQPIVELHTGNIHKAEALIRWQHPMRNFVYPNDFIQLAEETGMINEIGDWVFKEATRQVTEWRDVLTDDFQISVNTSPLQYKDGGTNLSDWIAYLSDVGLPANAVVVEITEGLLMNTGEEVLNKLLTLRDAGIQVSLDDFGTGYSSLSYLKKFDIDYLKIDRSFVSNLSIDSNDFALCQAIIVMAHKLGLMVVAEGIETEHQRNLLLAAGCDYGQGFYYSKPVSSRDFEALYKRVYSMNWYEHS